MKAAFAEPEVITRKGKPVSVIIPIKEYEALLERLEDAEDLAYLKEAHTKALSFRPLKESLAERKKARV
ncbi:MAG TPA: type II toxin-antitoxin system prevent-host-death family antitoxin [Chthoniobacteraceae bacterium]|jgi:PHD/YefM family antitoxin component YafN of YafNO toxin-antitoxin module|nr:type II toxin-antitoxin system prevent-host-death family antitoxin [Chthoniobacteraceae bacterium]